MNEQVWDYFFVPTYRYEHTGKIKDHIGAKQGGPRTPTKGSFRTKYLKCVQCDMWLAPVNGDDRLWQREEWEPFLWKHIYDYHDIDEVIMITLRGNE